MTRERKEKTLQTPNRLIRGGHNDKYISELQTYELPDIQGGVRSYNNQRLNKESLDQLNQFNTHGSINMNSGISKDRVRSRQGVGLKNASVPLTQESAIREEDSIP